jgi:hypothetical protein
MRSRPTDGRIACRCQGKRPISRATTVRAASVIRVVSLSCQNLGKTQKFMPVRESSGEYRLNHVKGWAAPETKAAVEQARLLLEQAETVGETPEDPLLLFSVLFWRCVLARTR